MDSNQVVYSGQSYSEGRSRRGRLVVIGLLAILVLVGIWLAAVFLLPKNNASAKAGQFMKLFSEGKAQEAYALTDDSFKETTPEDAWMTLVDRISKAYATKPALQSAEYNPDTDVTQVKFTADGNNGNGPYDITVEVSQVDKEYQIRYFKSTKQNSDSAD